MWPRCSEPDGYGSCSSTYDFGRTRSSEASGARSAAQTSCHFASIACGSYVSIVVSGNENGLSRGRGEQPRRPPRGLSALGKELLHRCPECSSGGQWTP